MIVCHKTRSPLALEDAKTIEANDVRFDLKDWRAIRFDEPSAMRKDLAAALVQHNSQLNL